MNTWHEFKIPAFSPVLLNISFIACAFLLALYTSQPVYAFAVAVPIGGILQLAIQIPGLFKIGMLPKISFRPISALTEPAVKRVLKIWSRQFSLSPLHNSAS